MTYHATNKPAINDAEILEWITRGWLVVQLNQAGRNEVWKWHGSWRKLVKVKVYSCDEDGRLRCNLRIGAKGNGGRQRTCYLNKLVWMFHRREVVPAGYVLDHVNGICTDDAFDNLELMTQEESNRQGRMMQGIDEEDYGEF